MRQARIVHTLLRVWLGLVILFLLLPILVVVPLSAIHARGPIERADLIEGLLVHMVLIALPIAYSVRAFSKEQISVPACRAV